MGHVESAPSGADTQTTVTELSWHNTSEPLDVSGDNLVVPTDALIIINELNNRTFIDGAGRLPPTRPADVRNYYDVNGDGFLSAIDALIIINFLNATARPRGKQALQRR